MTLITYLARVHFADGVLEEALVSELERSKYSKPLLLGLHEAQPTEFSERVRSGMPYQCTPVRYAINPTHSVDQIVPDIIDIADHENIDVIVAYGSSQAISIAAECCQNLTDRRIKELSSSKPTATDKPAIPDFFAIPGIDGLPDLSRPKRTFGSWGAMYSGVRLQPSVAIYDPTLTLGENPERTASAAMNTLARCVEAYLSENYNPPADGIAYDGILRIVKHLPSTSAVDDLDNRREQMAASLEGTLALQKGSGIAQDIVDALATVSGLDLNEGALKRLLLPLSVDIIESTGCVERIQIIRRALNIPARNTFNEGLNSVLSNLPLPGTLHAHGLTNDHISQAAAILLDCRMDSHPRTSKLKSLMGELLLAAEPVAS